MNPIALNLVVLRSSDLAGGGVDYAPTDVTKGPLTVELTFH
ncbi:MAG: hypothetical protein ABJF10_03410 [Chthoniobacter sp.]